MESQVDHFIKGSPSWLATKGPENDIVVSSRIRIARNIHSYPFTHRLEPFQRDELIDLVRSATAKTEWMKKSLFLHSRELTDIDSQLLLERHLISRELASEKNDHAAVVTPDEMVSLLVLEEDHLRFQVFQAGFNLMEAWRIVDEMDTDLEKHVEYAYNSQLGYATACPTNVGTGLRASCMLHLPGLVLTKQAQKVLQALSKLNIAVRGLYGEGSQATGNLFQFSNQVTLGQTETEIIDSLECVIRQVLNHEREARNFLKTKRKYNYEDQLWRALGTLKSARSLSSQEATQLISLVELGVDDQVFGEGLTAASMHELFLLIQPAHLQKLKGELLEAKERDVYRASLIRDKLCNVQL